MRDWTRSTRLPAPDLTLLDQCTERLRCQDHDIDDLTTLEAHGNGVVSGSHGWPELGHQFDVRGTFIFRRQFHPGGREAAGSHHLDLGGLRLGSVKQRKCKSEGSKRDNPPMENRLHRHPSSVFRQYGVPGIAIVLAHLLVDVILGEWTEAVRHCPTIAT